MDPAVLDVFAIDIRLRQLLPVILVAAILGAGLAFQGFRL